MTRTEKLLKALVNGDGADVEPISDIERYYFAMLNGETDVPEPNTPIEAYLYQLCKNGVSGGGTSDVTVTDDGEGNVTILGMTVNDGDDVIIGG